MGSRAARYANSWAERTSHGDARPATNLGPCRLTLALVLPTLLIGMAQGHAGTVSHKRHRPTPVTTSRDLESDTTGAIPKPSPPPAAGGASAADKDDGPLPPPFRLPTAPRKRMRDCGMKWQAMKMSGEAGDDIWRSFATHCLAAAKGPFDDRPSNR